jgi:hypothetical protein
VACHARILFFYYSCIFSHFFTFFDNNQHQNIYISFIYNHTIIIFYITIQIKKNSKIQIFFTLYSNLLFFTNFKKITTHYFNIQITCQTNSKTYFSTFIGEKKCYFQYLFFQYQDYSCRSHKFYCGTYDLTGGKNEFKP